MDAIEFSSEAMHNNAKKEYPESMDNWFKHDQTLTEAEFEELEAEEDEWDKESWELFKLVDPYIHSMEYLSFHEKTWLYMSRNDMTANALANKLNVSKYVLSKCRANPANNWVLAEKLIKLCEEVGLPCNKELEALQATKLIEEA